jgi:hypothetical protein
VSKTYDTKDVHLFIDAVMQLDERQRVNLWYSIVYGPLPDHPAEMLRRFKEQCTWTRANILFRFGPIIDKIVRDEAQLWAKIAREEDGENG